MGESSRIFVKNLPPKITEADFRKHFSRGREITDIKLIPNRRIGFVGFKSSQDAAHAVKYFDRSYIRMSRIAVALAKPVFDGSLPREEPSRGTGPSKSLATHTVPSTDAESKKRKRSALDEAADPKLGEFLEVMNPGKKQRDDLAVQDDEHPAEAVPPPATAESDDEYEDLPYRNRKSDGGRSHETGLEAPVWSSPTDKVVILDDDVPLREAPAVAVDASDESWLRSRTNRLLDLVDADDLSLVKQIATVAPPVDHAVNEEVNENQSGAEAAGEDDGAETPAGDQDNDSSVDLISKTARIFVRNLPYTATEDDIHGHFSKFGSVQEVHLPVCSRGRSKGYALVLFDDHQDAIKAFRNADGMTFQGRIIHLLPAQAKRSLDDFALSKLPLKKQNLLRKKAAASSSFNWNALYMSQDAVNASISQRLGVSKSDFLDPTSSDAAIKQAIAEGQLIQETKAYFAANGVDLDAFKSQQRRNDKAILVKNFPFGTSMEELRKLFEEHGKVLRVLMPPAGTIAIVEMTDAKDAFAKLAYRRFKESILFLEKAPQSVLKATPTPGGRPAEITDKSGVTELLARDEKQDVHETSSLYVGNLNFSTTTAALADEFRPLDGFVSAVVKTKQDPKKPGQVLSMGFGFVAFRSKEQALSALAAMEGRSLDGHVLALKASHRGLDAAEERRREDRAKKAGGQRTKVIIKNLPFESTRADVRRLFSTYGQLRSVRLPKKFDHSSRGYAFIDFISPREAENAMNALSDVHVLGRRLVLEWADAEELDPEEEIRKMEGKVQKQVNKVILQQLTGKGRTKVQIGETEDEA